MIYPANYGFIPQTLSDDGDPLDVLVLSNSPVVSGAVVRCRPVGALIMKDQAGPDEKIIAVPTDDLHPFLTQGVQNYTDLPDILLKQIVHFFQHYKDLEPNKWTRVGALGRRHGGKAETADRRGGHRAREGQRPAKLECTRRSKPR